MQSKDTHFVSKGPINHNLEKQAKSLFEQWFILFDYPDLNGLPYKTNGGSFFLEEKYNLYIPDGWDVVSIGSILDKYPSTKRFETDSYQKSGRFPIVDQGDKFIVGYTDDESNVLKRKPAVLFGDHSTKIKFLDFEFGRGADGTQILYSNCPNVNQFYLFLTIYHLTIPNPGYSRHFKYLKELPIIIPEMRVARDFEQICYPLYKAWTSNVFNNIELLKIKDTLLPLLINGQLSPYID